MNAIILAGGKGSRLAPWPAPKCLLPINGVPMLYSILLRLRGFVDRAVVCTGYRAGDVQRALSVGFWYQPEEILSVHCSSAGEDVPMGVRLLQARELTDGSRVLVLYGDELADVDISRLLDAHGGNVLTFTCFQAPVPGGTVLVGYDSIHIHEERRQLINIGFVVVEPEAWQSLRPEDGLSDWINRVAMPQHYIKGENNPATLVLTKQRVGIYHHPGKRATVNSLADLVQAEEIWR